MRALSLLLLPLVVVVACGGDDKPPPENGVNDVKKACEIRKAWESRNLQQCTQCIAVAESPKCDCPAFQQDYAAKCYDQALARNQEPTCDGTTGCVSKCDPQDCDCVDACFAGKEKCRELTSAADGCTTFYCDQYCK